MTDLFQLDLARRGAVRDAATGRGYGTGPTGCWRGFGQMLRATTIRSIGHVQPELSNLEVPEFSALVPFLPHDDTRSTVLRYSTSTCLSKTPVGTPNTNPGPPRAAPATGAQTHYSTASPLLLRYLRSLR